MIAPPDALITTVPDVNVAFDAAIATPPPPPPPPAENEIVEPTVPIVMFPFADSELVAGTANPTDPAALLIVIAPTLADMTTVPEVKVVLEAAIATPPPPPAPPTMLMLFPFWLSVMFAPPASCIVPEDTPAITPAVLPARVTCRTMFCV